MIDARQAANLSSDYLKDFYPKAGNIKLEEVEFDEIENHWYITLSFESGEHYSLNFNQPREYKIFRLDANDGKVKSMKIRVLQ